MATLVNLPKTAIKFQAKKKIELEDDKHDSVIKRGEEFYLLHKEKDYFLFDPEGAKYAKFKLTRKKYKELADTHTLVPTRVQKLRSRVLSVKPTKKSTVNTRNKKLKASTLKVLDRLEDQLSIKGRALETLLTVDEFKHLTLITSIVQNIKLYEATNVVLNALSSEFILDITTLLDKLGTLTKGRPQQVFLANFIRRLSTKYRVTLGHGEDVIAILQKRKDNPRTFKINHKLPSSN